MSCLPLVRLWIWISVAATTAGWTLSAFGMLNRVGYAFFIAVTVVCLFVFRNSWASEWKRKSIDCRRLRVRFSRGLPLSFLVLAILVFLGGVLYAPTNHTALTYRIPRVLQWLARGQWFWVHTSNYRMNDRACGIEWLSAPLLLFTRSDRSLFLLNFVPWLLMPGLVFSLFTRIGVHRKMAWAWMWLLPTGYTFMLQAGSTANDSYATIYALAAVDFACRAWVSRRRSDQIYSLLAAALLTGAKASNLPLLLPWAVVFGAMFFLRNNNAPFGKLNKIAFVSVPLLAALVSFLPTALLNIRYCGDWSGLAMERTGMDMKNPIVGIWGNSLLFLLDNLVPPFFPAASWWNQNGLSILPGFIVRPLVANFESSFHWVGELPTEDWVGIGFGLSCLVMISLFVARRTKRCDRPVVETGLCLPRRIRQGVALAGWVALLAYCIKSGMSTGARLISPYYPFLLPALLWGPSQAAIVRQRWWKVAVWIVLAMAVPVVMLTPGRPLWPAQTILSYLHNHYPENRLLLRAFNVYSIYGTRADPLAPVRSLLPSQLPVVGFLGRGDDPDISFWRPFGATRVEHILTTDSATEIRQRGIDYIIAGEFNFALNGTSFAEWQHRTGVKEIATTNLTVRVSEGPQPWHIVRLPP